MPGEASDMLPEMCASGKTWPTVLPFGIRVGFKNEPVCQFPECSAAATWGSRPLKHPHFTKIQRFCESYACFNLDFSTPFVGLLW